MRSPVQELEAIWWSVLVAYGEWFWVVFFTGTAVGLLLFVVDLILSRGRDARDSHD